MFIFMLENEKQEKWNYHYLGNQNSINLGTKQQWEQRKKSIHHAHKRQDKSSELFFHCHSIVRWCTIIELTTK